MSASPSARHNPFVGRGAELALLDEVVARGDVAFVTGPLGIGKTALLLAYQARCAARGLPAVALDPQLDVAARADLVAAGHRLPATGAALVVDDFHLLHGLERWIVLRWLATLPATVAIVIGSETAPAPVWLEAGAPRLQQIALGALPTADARAAIAQRGVTGPRADVVVELARGNPLILAVACDVARQAPEAISAAHISQDVLTRLVPTLCTGGDTDGKRTAFAALLACRTLGRQLFDAVLEPVDRDAVWTWLRQRSVVEEVADGLRVHPAMRKPCLDWLRANQPAMFPPLHRRLAAFYNARLLDSPDPGRWTLDRLFLDRDLPALQPYFRWDGDDPGMLVDRLDAADGDAIGAMVEAHEGAPARADVARWLATRPHEFDVLRRPNGEVGGYLLALRFVGGPPSRAERADPAIEVAASYVARVAPPHANLLVFHSWMARASNQLPGPEATTLITQMTRRLLMTPTLQFHFSVTREPERWLPLMRFLGFDHDVAGTFVRGGVTHTVIVNDWRRQTMAEFLARSSETALASLYERGRVAPPPAEPARATPELSELLWHRVEQIAGRLKMSAREREVLDLLLLGRSSTEIGAALGITERTARFHQANVLDKLGAETRLDILRMLL